MILLLIIINVLSGLFFYCHSIMGGVGKKRWTFAGLIFGPLIWPMFNNNKRMKVYRQNGIAGLVLKA